MRDKVQCNLCGRYVESLITSFIEGTNLDVCEECSKLGKAVKKAAVPEHSLIPKKTIQIEASKEDIVDDYAEIIKNAREKKGLKQEELARKIFEKDTLIHRIESGHMKPSIDFARKLEKALNIRLVEIKNTEFSCETPKGKKQEMTIGDLIKIKR